MNSDHNDDHPFLNPPGGQEPALRARMPRPRSGNDWARYGRRRKRGAAIFNGAQRRRMKRNGF